MGKHGISCRRWVGRSAVVVLLAVPGTVARPFIVPALAQGQAVSPAAGATGVDLSTPEATLKSFARLVVTRDFDRAVQCVKGAVPGPVTELLGRDQEAPVSASHIEHISIQASGENDAVATFTDVPVAMVGAQAWPSRTETVSLHKGASGWQIVPAEATGLRRVMGTGMVGMFSALMANPDMALRMLPHRPADPVWKKRQTAQYLDGVGNPLRLQVGQTARLYRDKTRVPVFVAAQQEQAEAFKSYLKLKALREAHPAPFTTADDGFTDAEFAGALAKAQSVANNLLETRAVQWLPHGTPVRILAHETPKDLYARLTTLVGESDLEFARDSPLPMGGLWQVTVLNGNAEGKTVWTYSLCSSAPNDGDFVTLVIPNKPEASVTVATDDRAGQALWASGRPTSGTAAQQFDDMLKAHRVVFLPAGQRCVVDYPDRMGTLTVVPVDGKYQGMHFYINLANAALVP